MDSDIKIIDLKTAEKNFKNPESSAISRRRKRFSNKLDLPFDSRPIEPGSTSIFSKISNKNTILLIILCFIAISFSLFINTFNSKDFYKGNWQAQNEEFLKKSNIKSLFFKINEKEISQELIISVNEIETFSKINYKTQINSQTSSKIEFRIIEIKLENLEVQIPEKLCNSGVNCESLKEEIKNKFENDFNKNKLSELSQYFIFTKNSDENILKIPNSASYKLKSIEN